MAHVSIPQFFQDITGGARHARVDGATVGEILTALDQLHPGMEAKIRDGHAIAPIVAITIDGRIATQGLDTPVLPNSNVCLLPSFGGG